MCDYSKMWKLLKLSATYLAYTIFHNLTLSYMGVIVLYNLAYIIFYLFEIGLKYRQLNDFSLKYRTSARPDF